jgi:hypothetical protein
LNNLIITIIGIALVAVAAAMGLFYGGTAYENSNAQALAATLLSQTHQLYAANMQYMIDHGMESFNDFPNDNISPNYTDGLVPIFNVPVHNLYNQDEIICPSSGDVTLSGQQVYMQRSHGNLFGNNVIVYNLFAGSNPAACGGNSIGAIDLSLASSANNILVKICKAINSLTVIPSSGFTIAASGLPYSNTGTSTTWNNLPNDQFDYVNDPNAVNLCVISTNGYYAGGNGASFDEMIMMFTN